MDSFVPGPATERRFRDVLGGFPTGVTVVTTMTPDGPLALTANSFSSVSLDPPLVLWSVAITSRRHDPFVAAQSFAINLVGNTDLEDALAFARDGWDFSHVEWRLGKGGAPVLNGAIGVLECTLHANHGAGDHTIILGRVEHATKAEGGPVVFSQGQYGQFTAFVDS